MEIDNDLFEFEAGLQDTNADESFKDTIANTTEDVKQDTNAKTDEGDSEKSPEPEKASEAPADSSKTDEGADVQSQENITVNFLGEEKTLPISEAKQLVQKGLNYDHVNAELQKLKSIESDTIYAEIKKIAAISQVPLSSFATELEKGIKANLVNELIAKGCSEEIAGSYADSIIAERKSKAESTEQALKAEREQEEKAKIAAEVEKFSVMFPNVKEFSPQAITLINQGMTPTEAYLKIEANQKIQELKTQLAGLKKNEENKQKSVGSATTQTADSKTDDFMLGFMS